MLFDVHHHQFRERDVMRFGVVDDQAVGAVALDLVDELVGVSQRACRDVDGLVTALTNADFPRGVELRELNLDGLAVEGGCRLQLGHKFVGLFGLVEAKRAPRFGSVRDSDDEGERFCKLAMMALQCPRRNL